MKLNIRGLLLVVLLFVLMYGVFAVYRGLGSIHDALATFRWASFAVACALAFGNYLLRFAKWEFYLARLGIRGSSTVSAKGEAAPEPYRISGAAGPSVSKSPLTTLESFLIFLSGFVLTVTPGKVGEVFKSYVLQSTHGVPVARTGPIVIAERLTDLVGIIVLIVAGALGFHDGLGWAAIGAALAIALLVIVGSRKLSIGILDMLARLPGPIGRIAPKLYASYDSLSTLVAPRNLLVPTLLSIVAWSLECLSLWVILRGFGQSTSVMLCTFFYATSTLIGALVPVPGGLGFTEAALQEQMILKGGVPKGVSTAAMILVRFATLWFAVLVGFVALWALRRMHPALLSDSNDRTRDAAEVA